jgi:shikimate kinase
VLKNIIAMKKKSLQALTKAEFIAHYNALTLRIVLIGMSNAGKSRRAKELMESLDFFVYSVDAEIAKELGLRDVEAIGEWLGHPDVPGYKEKEKIYLALEEKFSDIAYIEKHVPRGKNIVFDTTGSVAHLSEEIRTKLYEHCLVVYLTVDSIERMIENFFETVKPLIWGDYFSQREGESRDEALRRSYPELLAFREERYASGLNVVKIPAHILWDATAECILNTILSRLPGSLEEKNPETGEMEDIEIPWRKST